MSDIHDLLSKHFLEETSAQEELEVAAYKASNEKEYTLLKKLWSTEGIKVSDFDKTKAWESVAAKSSKPKQSGKLIALRRVAAVAAVFLLVAFVGSKFFLSTDNAPAMAEVIGDGSKDGIALSDGSIVYLNKDAVFKYPKNFTDDQRSVSLDGEAYFEIARDVDRPFQIKAPHATVEVLGTAFNVRSDQSSTEVSVTSGKVRVNSVYDDNEVVLITDQSALVSKETFESSLEQRTNFLSWKTGAFVFKDILISEVVADLNSYYGDRIILSNVNNECIPNASFNKDDINEVIEILKLSCSLEVNENNGMYELH